MLLKVRQGPSDNKKALRKEGLLNFYVCHIHNAANLPQECFFVRFVCFIVIMMVAKISWQWFQPKKSPIILFFTQVCY
jgi:hypothetical protein